MKRLIALLLVILMTAVFFGCKKIDPDDNNDPVEKTDEPAAETDPPKDEAEYAVKDAMLLGGRPTNGSCRVFYEIFVGSFSDSDGDGIGDLRGIINRMDYLNDGDPASGLSLGVEGLWLSPIFKSSSYHKYDVNDYYTIDESFGTEEDLKELIRICHERDVYVILDLPINHTSRGNQWFKDFAEAHRNGDTASAYYDLYSWYDSSIDHAPAGRAFSQLIGTTHYFECNFSDNMPELNFDSLLARELVYDVAKHYIELGVDGFRFDAVKYVYYGDHQRSVEFWTEYMNKLRELNPNLYAVGEVWDNDLITDKYYPALNCFDFTISQSSGLIAETAKKGDVNRYTAYVKSYLDKVQALREGATIVPFISNHDMDRAAGFLPTASFAMQMAANLYILGPGSPFIYYGEELGMRGSRGGADTDANRRLKMLWGDGDTVRDPNGSTYGSANQIDTTVKDQAADENSLYTYYKKLIMIRKANPEIAEGTYTPIKLSDTKVGGFIASLGNSSVLVIHNTTGQTQTIDLSLIPGVSVTVLRAVIGMENASLDGNILTIGAMTSVVLG
ncbi:MAG: hypothetical protein J5854_01415 [Clostridia bacterium]|nr:hypothetical protein [Clostridia bacterium]